MKLASRLHRLERQLGRAQRCCAHPEIAMILGREAIEPCSPIPDGVPRCRCCGDRHVLVIEEVVVEPGDPLARGESCAEPTA